VVVDIQSLIAEYAARHGRTFGSLQAMLQASLVLAVPLGSPAVIADLLDQIAAEVEISA